MEIKRDCIIYNQNKCIGLTYTWCKREECSFYKSDKEYDREKYLKELKDLGISK